MTRRGKIARLPRTVREELNQRIEDGETGARLVEWLNGREDVQELLKVHFSGRPINEQNVSDWRAGGYADWQQRQEEFSLANGIMDDAAERKELVTEGRLSDHVGDMAALSLARMLRAMRRMEDGPEQWETTLKVVRQVVRLRQSDREHERAQRLQETHERCEGEAWLRSGDNFASGQDWQRAGNDFASDQERLDQLIMHALVAAGRGKLEDIPPPTPPRRSRKRAKGAEDGVQRTEDGAQETGDGRQGTGDEARACEAGGTAMGESQSPTQPVDSGSGAAAHPEPQSALADKPAEAGKQGAANEVMPQGPAVDQGSSRLIKVNQGSLLAAREAPASERPEFPCSILVESKVDAGTQAGSRVRQAQRPEPVEGESQPHLSQPDMETLTPPQYQ